MKIIKLRRTRISPNAHAYLEVCLTFEEIDDRDFIASLAVNLGDLVQSDGCPQAGILMDVPGFLLPTFRDLNSYAFNVRKSHGKKTKTHIKFDDANASLLLELKLPASDNLLRTSPTQARELTMEATANELHRLQADIRERSALQSDSLW